MCDSWNSTTSSRAVTCTVITVIAVQLEGVLVTELSRRQRMLDPVALSIITNTITDPRERARAIGVWGGTIGVSMALGPIVGGALVGAVGWRAIFWINIPVGLAAVLLTALFVPESKAPRPRRVDPLWQPLVIL